MLPLVKTDFNVFPKSGGIIITSCLSITNSLWEEKNNKLEQAILSNLLKGILAQVL